MNCPICLVDLFGSTSLKVTSCGHLFHEDCITTYIKSGGNSCPNCKARMINRSLRPVHGHQGVSSLPQQNVEQSSKTNETSRIPARRTIRLNAIDDAKNDGTNNKDDTLQIEDAQSIALQTGDTSHNTGSNSNDATSVIQDADPNAPQFDSEASMNNNQKNGCVTVTQSNEVISEASQMVRAETLPCIRSISANQEKLVRSVSYHGFNLEFCAPSASNTASNAQPFIDALQNGLKPKTIPIRPQSVQSVIGAQNPDAKGVSNSHSLESTDQNKESLAYDSNNPKKIYVISNVVLGQLNLNGQRAANASFATANEIQNIIPSTSGLNRLVRTQSANIQSVPKKKLNRSKSIHVDRNVRLGQIKEKSRQIQPQCRRSSRIRVPVAHFNYGSVRCYVCGKSFRQDIPINLYGGDIACSFDCAKRQH